MDNLTICKKNELIENFIFNASESELQILNYAVAVTNPEWDNKNLIYQISIPDLVKIYQTRSNNLYKHYKNALLRLMDRKYSFYCYERNKKITENLIIQVIEDLDNTSYLEFKFNDYISSRISNLQGLFTKYNIKHIAMFKSRYAFLLYEYFKMNLQQCESKMFNVKFTISDFKKKLDISSKYDLFFNLENKVLKVAKNNINKHSDIKFSYTVNRKGKTPVSITFRAQYKSKENDDQLVNFNNSTIESSVSQKTEVVPSPNAKNILDGIKKEIGYKKLVKT